LGAICGAYCDHELTCRVLEERPIPLRAGGREADHDRLAGVPECGAAAYLFRPGPLGARYQGPAAGRRPPSDVHGNSAARPGPSSSPGEVASHRDQAQSHSQQCLPRGTTRPPPRSKPREQSRRGHGTGPAEAPLAQANQAPPETDHGTQPNTERSHGMTTKTTSARAQGKGSLGRSSCGIAQAGSAMCLLRGRGAEP